MLSEARAILFRLQERGSHVTCARSLLTVFGKLLRGRSMASAASRFEFLWVLSYEQTGKHSIPRSVCKDFQRCVRPESISGSCGLEFVVRLTSEQLQECSSSRTFAYTAPRLALPSYDGFVLDVFSKSEYSRELVYIIPGIQNAWVLFLLTSPSKTPSEMPTRS